MLRVVGLGEVLITMVITLGVMPGDSLRRARRGLHGGLEVGSHQASTAAPGEMEGRQAILALQQSSRAQTGAPRQARTTRPTGRRGHRSRR